MSNIAKNIGIGISVLSLLFSLLSSWTYFYSEQKIQVIKNQSQDRIIEKHEDELKSMYSQQSKIIETISYNSRDITTVQRNIDKLIDLQQQNQIYLTKIASKVGVNER